jgi:hypothetical protein
MALQPTSGPYLSSDRRLSTKLVPAFADRGCHVVSVANLHSRNFDFIDRSRYYFFQVAPQMSSRGWVDPVPDPLLLRKSSSAGNRTRNPCICVQKLTTRPQGRSQIWDTLGIKPLRIIIHAQIWTFLSGEKERERKKRGLFPSHYRTELLSHLHEYKTRTYTKIDYVWNIQHDIYGISVSSPCGGCNRERH